MLNGKILKIKRIEKELENIFNYPLTIVSASMGYGKTTAVRTYLNNHRQIQLSWISLIRNCEMEKLLWSKIISALGDIEPEIEIKLNQFTFPLDVKQMEIVISLIKRFVKNKKIVIVIDDYHVVKDDKNIGNILETLIQANIHDFHVVIITRTRPKFNYINLLSKGLCYYIGANVLALRSNEIKEYFKLMEFMPNDDNLNMINNYTNGWISAVYLILLGLKQGFFINENSNINQLVEVNFFNTLDKSTQQTLLYLSILDSFSLRQATYILEQENLFLILDMLLEQNAFTEFDIKTNIYKFHNVLLDFLRRKVENCNMDLSNVLYRAGQWYFDQRNISDAFYYYNRAGKIEELLSKISKMDFIEISFLEYKIQQEIYLLDNKFCIRFPIIFLQIALNFILIGQKEFAIHGIEIINKIRDHFSQNMDVTSDFKNRILGELEVIGIFLVFNDAQKMVELSQKAYEFFDGGLSSIVYRHSEFNFGVPHFLYTYYKNVGKLKDTLEILVNGFPPPIFDGCGYGCELVALSEYALETGNYQMAENYAHKAKYKAMIKMQIGIVINADFALMRLNLAKGNIVEAKQILSNTRNELNDMHNMLTDQCFSVYSSTLDMIEGYIYGCLKENELIPKWLCTGNYENIALIFNGMAFRCIVYGKSVMLTENWLKLEVMCESFKEEYNIFQNQLGILHNSIYEAVAKYNLYGISQGLEILVSALKDAKEDSILLPFAENCDFILPMLYELRNKKSIEELWLNLVIRYCEDYSNKTNEAQNKKINLTIREIQVLNLLEQGLTQRQIANELFISVSSVKRYLESLYVKLGANNKTIAIKNAKSMKII